jgi:hypothetical protein
MTGMLLVEVGVVLFAWAGLKTEYSQVARITGVSHQHLA